MLAQGQIRGAKTVAQTVSLRRLDYESTETKLNLPGCECLLFSSIVLVVAHRKLTVGATSLEAFALECRASDE
jgi:hypothetical protein